MKQTRVTVTDHMEVVVVTEQECDAYLDACHAQRTMRKKMEGHARHLKIADIPPVMYHREIVQPAQGEPDLHDVFLWKFLRDYPRYLTTEKRVDKPKRMI